MSTLQLVLVLALITSGCAHTISVESSPPGASVLVDGVPAGRTPMALAEKTGRDDLVSIEVERDGRTAHFAYQKTGVSTDAVIGATAASCGMCAVGVGETHAAGKIVHPSSVMAPAGQTCNNSG